MSNEKRFVVLVADADTLDTAQTQVFVDPGYNVTPKELAEALTEVNGCEIETVWEYNPRRSDCTPNELVEAFMDWARTERDQREADHVY